MQKDPKIWYYSESKNDYIRISSMGTRHLRNAINKLDRLVIYDYRGERIIENMYVRSHGFQEPVYQSLVNEYAKRDPSTDRDLDYIMEDAR